MKITKSPEWYFKAHWICFFTAWFFCIVPTLIVGYAKLPNIVVEQSAEKTLTGSAIIVFACAAYPLLKGILKLFKSPSAWLILWILAVFTYLLYSVPHETIEAMTIVFFVAAIGNTVGAVFFAVSKLMEKKSRIYGGK